MFKYRFGFIVPVFNTPTHLIDDCVRSILNQTLDDYCIVIVDDCSKSDVALHCDNISAENPQISVVHHTINKGLSEARNTGVRVIDAEWLLFIDSDDFIEPNSCEYFESVISKYKCDFYQFSGFLDYKKKTIECSFLYEDVKVFETYSDREFFQKRFLLDQTSVHIQNEFPIQSACTKLVSKSFILNNDVPFIGVKFAEDAIFHLHIIEKAESFAVVPFRFYHYRCVENSMVNSFRPNADIEQLGVMKEMWKFKDSFNKDESFEKALYTFCFISLQMCIWQKYFNKNNKKPLSLRKKELKLFIQNKPYCDIFKNIDYKHLTTNQKIKYILLRLKKYRLFVYLRDFYNKKKGKIS